MTTEHVPPLTNDEIDSLSEIPLREVPSETWQRVWRALRDHARLTQELSERADPQRIIDWLHSDKYKPPELAFTAGPERRIADALIACNVNRTIAELELGKVQKQLAERDAEIAQLRLRLLSAAGDDLCRLTPEEIKAYTSGAVQIPPVEEFLPSCQRFHEQIAAGAGVLDGCLTLAQLIAENEKLRRDSERLAKCNTPFTDDIEERVVVTQHRDGYWMWEPIDGGMSTGPFSSWREAYQAGAGYFIWLEQKQKAEAAEARCRELEQQVNATDLGHVAHGLKRITELEQQVQYLNRISVQKIAAIATERDEFRQQLVAVTAERERASAEVNQLVDEIGNYEKKLAASEAACGELRRLLARVRNPAECTSSMTADLAEAIKHALSTDSEGWVLHAEARRQQERIVQLEAALRAMPCDTNKRGEYTEAELQRRKLLEAKS